MPQFFFCAMLMCFSHIYFLIEQISRESFIFIETLPSFIFAAKDLCLMLYRVCLLSLHLFVKSDSIWLDCTWHSNSLRWQRIQISVRIRLPIVSFVPKKNSVYTRIFFLLPFFLFNELPFWYMPFYVTYTRKQRWKMKIMYLSSGE